MAVQDDILKKLGAPQMAEVQWRPGQRNFAAKVVMIDGERFTLFKGLHRYDGAVALRIKGDMQNNQRGRDMVARALDGMAEAVRLGHVEFE